MSFNRLNTDTCAYAQELSESVGRGEYKLAEPNRGANCVQCFPRDLEIRMQRSGVGIDSTRPMIDTNSDILNIERDASNCSMKKHLPVFDAQGNLVENRQPNVSFPDCSQLETEDTRLSNPSANLRGTGWNRWEWLCQDPQDKVHIPFDYFINTGIVERDNHRPCIPLVFHNLTMMLKLHLHQTIGLPQQSNNDAVVTQMMQVISTFNIFIRY